MKVQEWVMGIEEDGLEYGIPIPEEKRIERSEGRTGWNVAIRLKEAKLYLCMRGVFLDKEKKSQLLRELSGGEGGSCSNRMAGLGGRLAVLRRLCVQMVVLDDHLVELRHLYVQMAAQGGHLVELRHLCVQMVVLDGRLVVLRHLYAQMADLDDHLVVLDRISI